MKIPKIVSGLLSGLLVAALPQAFAAQLRLSDGTPQGTITITDQDAQDQNPEPGTITYEGPVGANWFLSISTGITKPSMGTPQVPYMHLGSYNFSSQNQGTLTVSFTETNFLAVGNFTAGIGGITDGSVTYTAYEDPDNKPFGTTTQLARLGPFSTPSFDGASSGTITASGPYSLTIQAVMEHPVAGESGFDATLSVTPAVPTLTLSCASQGVGQVNVPYSSFLVANGGVPAYTYSIIAGSLPNGLQLDSATGKVYGTPTTAGLFNFTAQVTDSAGGTAQQTVQQGCSINISPLGAIGDYVWQDGNGDGKQNEPANNGVNNVTVKLFSCADLVNALQTTQTANDAGGNPGYYQFAGLTGGCYVVQFVLPNGDVFTAPNAPGTTTANDSDANRSSGLSGQITLAAGETNLTIDAGLIPSLTLACASQGVGQVNVPYSSFLVANGGVPTYTYSIIAGSLPNGLQLDSATGKIYGTPTTAGLFTFTAQVTDSAGGTAQQTVHQGCSISVGGLPGLALVKSASATVIRPGDQVTYYYTVTNTGGFTIENINIVDDNGTPGYTADDYSVTPQPFSLAPGESKTFPILNMPPIAECMTVSGTNVEVGTLWYDVQTNGDVRVVYLQSRDVVDNTYGTNAAGYPNGHKFSDLTGSDQATFLFTDSKGNKVLEFQCDYISASMAYPSGYGTLGPSGGDGKMLIGSVANVLNYSTTITTDLNQAPAFYGFTVNSPKEPNWNWNYVDGYDVTVSAAAFGANGFGNVTVPVIHNSPSKLGFNAFYPTNACDSCVMNTASAVGTATVNGSNILIQASATATVCETTQPFAGVGDFVWYDANANGIQDAGESGINGVTVSLLDCSGNPVIGPGGQPITTVTANNPTTGQPGYYLFYNLLPGSYEIQFTLPSGYNAFSPQNVGGNDSVDSDADTTTGITDCITLAPGQTNLNVDAGMYVGVPGLVLVKSASTNTVTPGQPVTYTYTVSNTGTETINNIIIIDDNGTPNYPGDDFQVNSTPFNLAPGASPAVFTVIKTLPQTMCMTVNGTNMQVGTLWTEILPSGDVQVTYRQSRDIVDNTYGINAAGWPNGHKFSDLTGSDMAEFRFTDGMGNVVLDFQCDYISASSLFPSGYGTLGPNGGDGKMIVGSATSVLSYNTTLTTDLNQSPAFYGFTVNSPAPEASYPTWDYVDGYQVVVSQAVFGANGFGGVTIPLVHDSPSKIGVNAITPAACGSCVVNLATATGVGANSGGVAVASASAEVCTVPTTVPCTSGTTSIKADFNGTAIKAGNYIWFNSVVSFSGRGPKPATVIFDNVQVSFTANSVPTTLSLPPAIITYSTSATQASTVWDSVNNAWRTTVPVGFNGNVFLSGLNYAVPANLPGGIKGVTWSGDFSSNLSGLSANWKWAAAVYTQFNSDPSQLGVKPIDGGPQNPYNNADHAGTPENYKTFVTGGARGGGGSNFTGSYSGTAKATPCP